MKFTDFLFGSSGGIKTERVPKWNVQQQELFKNLYGTLPADMTKAWGPSAESTEYTNFLKNYQPWATSQVNAAYNPEATKRYYEETIAPTVREEYAGPGYWGTARAEAVTRGESELLNQVEMGRQQALFQAMMQTPQVMQELATWSEKYSDPTMNPYYKFALALLGLEPFDTVGGVQQPSTGLLGGMAPGVGAGIGYGLGSLIMSSEKVKKRIQPLTRKEHTANLAKIRRTNIYRYLYKHEPDDAELHTGLIAERAPKEIATPARNAIKLYDFTSMVASAVKALGDKIDALEVQHGVH